MLQPAYNLDSPVIATFVGVKREVALREIVSELFTRYGHAVPAAIVDDVLAGTTIELPRNADGSVSVHAYAEWHMALGEEMERFIEGC